MNYRTLHEFCLISHLAQPADISIKGSRRVMINRIEAEYGNYVVMLFYLLMKGYQSLVRMQLGIWHLFAMSNYEACVMHQISCRLYQCLLVMMIFDFRQYHIHRDTEMICFILWWMVDVDFFSSCLKIIVRKLIPLRMYGGVCFIPITVARYFYNEVFSAVLIEINFNQSNPMSIYLGWHTDELVWNSRQIFKC